MKIRFPLLTLCLVLPSGCFLEEQARKAGLIEVEELSPLAAPDNHYNSFHYEKMEFVPITVEESSWDERRVSVTLTQDFEMQTTEVTQGQWFAVMGKIKICHNEERHCPGERHLFGHEIGYYSTIFRSICPNYPVVCVSWKDAQDFIAKLNRKNDGYVYRLPSEAEWEYSAGKETSTTRLGDYAWYYGNSAGMAHRVGQKKANRWGLYDIYGNVWEQVQKTDTKTLPRRKNSLPANLFNIFSHVARGGSYMYAKMDLHSAGPLIRYGYDVGLRLVRTPAKLQKKGQTPTF